MHNPVVIAPGSEPGLLIAYRAFCPEFPFAEIRQTVGGLGAVTHTQDELPYGSFDPEYTALFPTLSAALSAVVDWGGRLWLEWDPRPHTPTGSRPGFNKADIDAAWDLLRQSGSTPVTADLVNGMPTIRLSDWSARPTLRDLIPGCLRADAYGCHYQASLGPVRVAWTEPRRRAA